MLLQGFKWIRGYVMVSIRGDGVEAFVNEALNQEIALWNIRKTGDRTVVAYTYVGHFFRFRPLLKQTGCRVHVEERKGFPFLLDKLEKRKFFVAGFALFLAGLFLLSSLIWDVQVHGNERIAAGDILDAARAEGVHPLQWKFRLKEPNELARRLQSRIDGLSWVGVDIQGTRVMITVVEATRPDAKPKEGPQHLVADKTAVVTDIQVVRGKPLVRVNQVVHKGDMLVSGVIGNEANQSVVGAEGVIKGIVWYESTIEVPLTRRYKTYTGEHYNRHYLILFNRALPLTGYGKKPYPQYETTEERNQLQWRDRPLPFGWLRQEVLEAQIVEQTISEAEAAAAGLERAKADLLSDRGKDAEIVSYNVLQQKVENGKVYMKVLFQIKEIISVGQPIVQGD